MVTRSSRNMVTISDSVKQNKKYSKNKLKKMDSGILSSGNSITSLVHLYHLLLEQVVCERKISGHTILLDQLSGL